MPNRSFESSAQRRAPLSSSLPCVRSMSQMYWWLVRVHRCGSALTTVSRYVASVPDQRLAWCCWAKSASWPRKVSSRPFAPGSASGSPASGSASREGRVRVSGLGGSFRRSAEIRAAVRGSYSLWLSGHMDTSDVETSLCTPKQEAFRSGHSSRLLRPARAVTVVFPFGSQVATISTPGGRYTTRETITRAGTKVSRFCFHGALDNARREVVASLAFRDTFWAASARKKKRRSLANLPRTVQNARSSRGEDDGGAQPADDALGGPGSDRRAFSGVDRRAGLRSRRTRS